ncbi:MAG: hypothetical protein V4666_08225 [Bacteroidota bacterium]
MPTPKYDFTASNGQLLATLDNTVPDFTNSEVLEYRAASINLSNPTSPQETKKILLYDYGDFEREFIFENFKTIGGAVPSDISNAYVLLRALIPSSSGGGGGGGGDASAANQVAGNNLLTTIASGGLDTVITGQATQTAVGQNIVLAVAGTGSTDAVGSRTVAIQITPTGTVSSGVVSFEGSNDNVNFVPVMLYDDASATANPATTVSPATGISRFFSGPIHFRYFRARISTVIGGGGSLQAFTILRQISFQPDIYTVTQATAANLNATITGTLTAVTPGVTATNLGKAEDAVHANGDTGVAFFGVRQDQTPNVPATSATGDYGFLGLNRWNAALVAGYEKTAKTFSCATNITIAAAATDIAVLPGNASNAVYVTKVVVSGIQTTAGTGLVQLVKRSTANTGGTSAAILSIAHDSADTAVSLPLSYTANPTTGTPVGTMRSETIVLGNATGTSTKAIWDFGERGKHVLLTGVAQGLAINLNGSTYAGGQISLYIEWLEI